MSALQFISYSITPIYSPFDVSLRSDHCPCLRTAYILCFAHRRAGHAGCPSSFVVPSAYDRTLLSHYIASAICHSVCSSTGYTSFYRHAAGLAWHVTRYAGQLLLGWIWVIPSCVYRRSEIQPHFCISTSRSRWHSSCASTFVF